MQKIIIGLAGLVVGAVIVGGIVFFINQPTPSIIPPNSTSSEPVVTPVSQAGAPLVTGNQDAIPSNSTVLVTGSVNPNGAPTTYWFEYGTTASLGTRTTAQDIGASFISITAPGYITHLQANTLYYFRLSAQNRYGVVEGNTYSFKTNNNPPPQGSVPTVRTDPATDITRAAISLHGQVNTNGAPSTYWFEYGENVDLGNTVATFQTIPTGSNSVSVMLSGLKPVTKYYFRLNGQNQYGTMTGTILTFTTKGPAASAPTIKTETAINITTSSATLQGHINPNDAETTYWIEYSKDSLLKNIVGTISPLPSLNGTVSTAVTGNAVNLTSNTRYYYRVVAKNQYGTTTGNTVNFRTK